MFAGNFGEPCTEPDVAWSPASLARQKALHHQIEPSRGSSPSMGYSETHLARRLASPASELVQICLQEKTSVKAKPHPLLRLRLRLSPYLPRRREKGEATSSQGEGLRTVAAIVATRPQPQGQWEFGIKIIPPHVKDWYKRCRPKHIHREAAIHERHLQAKYQAVWRGINELGLSYVFRNTRDMNVNLVREFYAGFDPENPEQLVPIRGRFIVFQPRNMQFLRCSGCSWGTLGPLHSPSYISRAETLCGVNSVAAWVRDKKTNRHRKFPKKNMKVEAQYLRQEAVEEEKEFDHIIAPPLRPTDLTNVRFKEENTTTSLTGAERNAHDDNFMAHLYGMMDLQFRIGGRPATT
ncbi:hypothetical protein A4A49_15868 [Nicotiana attenuata]|uniref:Uncharacterized protein n=1 Tax=Nicotiana attenuata TaxID=49451 RepID=A0A1J6IPX4_NICAT|nr:hypothetical protein A4A49_15868 [Nicotiana attenuata]